MQKSTGRNTGFSHHRTRENPVNNFLLAICFLQAGALIHMGFSQQPPQPQPRISIGTSGNIYIDQPANNTNVTVKRIGEQAR